MSLLTSVGGAILQNIAVTGVDIIFSVNNNADFFVVPVVPNPLPTISEAQDNDTFSAVTGDLSIIGEMKLREFTLESFAPTTKKYPFVRSLGSSGGKLLSFFRQSRVYDKVPMRVTWVQSNGAVLLNMPCLIDGFDWHKDKMGDIHYSLKVREYKLVGKQNAW